MKNELFGIERTQIDAKWGLPVENGFERKKKKKNRGDQWNKN